MTPPLAVTADSVRLVPLRPTAATADDDREDDGVTGVVGVVAAEPEPMEADVGVLAFTPGVDAVATAVVAVVGAPALALLAVDKADTTVDCCPSGFLVAFR